VSPESVAAWVSASCAAQGLPVKVTDAGAVARVVTLLGGPLGSGRAQARSASTARPRRALQPPHGSDPLDVESAALVGARFDDGVVEDGRNDGGLAGQVERGPLSA
jgi:hypothetical protein